LPDSAAQQIFDNSGQAVLEIYGSSETGGIAWRQQEQAWRLFPGLTLTAKDDGWQLASPYLAADSLFQLDDNISFLTDDRFMLHGRADRIVKIEEKRLSLTELEQRLLAVSWINEAHALVLTKHRDLVAVVLVLNEAGTQLLAKRGRNQLLKELRNTLAVYFEAVVLPRKWLFVDVLPLNAQGKINQALIISLLDFDNRKLPQVLNAQLATEEVQLHIKVPEDLVYFPDHFAEYPILPGVVQLAWAEHFGKLLFAIDKPFLQMEVVKFTKVIQPGDELTLALNWKVGAGKLYFNFTAGAQGYSSGRMVYG
ncbi:MAG: AMP-dependent synthetase, partial [Methylococcales bacterium]